VYKRDQRVSGQLFEQLHLAHDLSFERWWLIEKHDILEGISGPDQLWVARYILRRVGENFGLEVTFNPKPIKGDWNGTGCHSNFSTESTRNDGGYDAILGYMEKLAEKHTQHVYVYGKDNHYRLTGKHETSSMQKFSWAAAHRGCSVRIPTSTVEEKKGYFEDRRPAGNCDPYLVGGMLVDTVINDGTLGEQLVLTWRQFLQRGEDIEDGIEEGDSSPGPLAKAKPTMRSGKRVLTIDKLKPF